jgi:hypothetical protein
MINVTDRLVLAFYHVAKLNLYNEEERILQESNNKKMKQNKRITE